MTCRRQSCHFGEGGRGQLPFPLCHGLPSPSLWGGLLLTRIRFHYLVRIPVPLLWHLPGWPPFREMRARRRVRKRFPPTDPRIPRTSSGSQPRAVEKESRLFTRKAPFSTGKVNIKEAFSVLVCGQSMPSSERQWQQQGSGTRRTGTAKATKASIWFLFTYERESTNRIREQNCNKFSSLLGDQGWVRWKERKHVKASIFPDVQDKEHPRTDKLAAPPYLLLRDGKFFVFFFNTWDPSVYRLSQTG